MIYLTESMATEEVVNLVDKLTHGYHAAISTIVSIVSVVIIFAIWDRATIKKSIRTDFEKILEEKTKLLQNDFDENMSRIKSENNLEIKRMEVALQVQYLKTNIRNRSSRLNRNLIWSNIKILLSKSIDFIESVEKTEFLSKAKKSAMIEKVVGSIVYILDMSQDPNNLLFKKLSDKHFQHLENINKKIKKINILLEGVEFVKMENSIEQIDIKQNILIQKDK